MRNVSITSLCLGFVLCAVAFSAPAQALPQCSSTVLKNCSHTCGAQHATAKDTLMSCTAKFGKCMMDCKAAKKCS